MVSNLKALISKLNATSRGAVEGAAALCLSHTHYEIEIEHVLLKVLESDNTDLLRIFKHFGIDAGRVLRDLTRAVEAFKSGNPRKPSLSTSLLGLLEEAWMVASVEFEDQQIRSGHLLATMLMNRARFRAVLSASRDIRDISAEELKTVFYKVVTGSAEDEEKPKAAESASEGDTDEPSRPKGDTALDKYTVDLTEQARSGKIDPIVGRDQEIRQMVDILMRRRQNNPILTGEPGVGKTAVAEGLAVQIASGDVPPPLQKVSIRSLDLGLLQAGAGVRGEFENRLKSVISEVKASPQPIIMFIDEAHTLIGAGGSAGQGDAANLLKPALARGELRTIAATTWSEYKKYFEKDAALTRRFQVVKVEEPSESKAIIMMQGMVPRLEEHHQVRILSSAVADSVRLSHRYLSDRNLPDKSVSVLDTACARVAVSQCATPAAIEDLQRRQSHLAQELEILERETVIGAEHSGRMEEIAAQQVDIADELRQMSERWQEEQTLVEQLIKVRALLEASPAEVVDDDEGEARVILRGQEAEADDADAEVAADQGHDELALMDRDALLSKQADLEAGLRHLQGESPLIHPVVDSSVIAAVISGWTGIPIGKMLADELSTLRNLNRTMAERVIGQDHAMLAIAQQIQASKASLDDPSKPVGVFLLVGPSGVGKTETALTLADLLYGGERNLITINMSEYQESHTVSSLKGAPPGYVGYGEGGVLTEAVRRKPYSVVLLDEIEKAHPDVMELFYQVFDKGRMEDGEGRVIDFRNTIILLTSNLATDSIMQLTQRGKIRPDVDELAEQIRPELQHHLKPALVGRMRSVPYYPLSDDALEGIVRLKLGKVARRLEAGQKVELTWADEVVANIVARCTEVDTGARNVDHILSRTLLPALSGEVLNSMAEGRELSSVQITMTEEGLFGYDLSYKE